MHSRRVGVIVSGSLVGGLEMKLDEWYSVEDIRAGKFVVIEGEKSRFFCMVTDVRLDTTNPQVLADPPDEKKISCARCYTALRPMAPCACVRCS